MLNWDLKCHEKICYNWNFYATGIECVFAIERLIVEEQDENEKILQSLKCVLIGF